MNLGIRVFYILDDDFPAFSEALARHDRARGTGNVANAALISTLTLAEAADHRIACYLLRIGKSSTYCHYMFKTTTQTLLATFKPEQYVSCMLDIQLVST